MLDAIKYDNLLRKALNKWGFVHSYEFDSSRLYENHVIIRPRTGLVRIFEQHGVIFEKGELIARIVEEPESVKHDHPPYSKLSYGRFSIEIVREREMMMGVIGAILESFPDKINVTFDGRQG